MNYLSFTAVSVSISSFETRLDFHYLQTYFSLCICLCIHVQTCILHATHPAYTDMPSISVPLFINIYLMREDQLLFIMVLSCNLMLSLTHNKESVSSLGDTILCSYQVKFGKRRTGCGQLEYDLTALKRVDLLWSIKQ